MQNKEFRTQVENAVFSLNSRLRNLPDVLTNEKVIAAAYLLYLTGKQNYAFDNVNEIIDNDYFAAEKKYFITNFVNEEAWQSVQPLAREYASDVFKEIVLTYENPSKNEPDTSTPSSLTKLAIKILNIQDNENVVDLCSGYGTFLLNAATTIPKAHYYGYDLNAPCKDITDIRANLLNVNIKTETIDIFELAQRQSAIHNFDKLFSNYPLGLQRKDLSSAGHEFIKTLTDINPYIFPSTSQNWIFNSLLLRLMKDNGKAVAIMTNGACYNHANLQARRYFVDNCFVEAVISLPAKLFNFTALPLTMIVFSNRKSAVRMIDATKMFTKGRRTNILSDKNIEDILFAYNNDTENSISVGNTELKVNEYALSPQRFLTKNITFNNGMPFKDVIKKIKRATPVSASALDRMSSNEETNIKYLRLQDIQSGIIRDDLHCLKEIEPRQVQYLLKDEDLILSKIGFPYKVAVAKIVPGQSVLPVGNMYAIELDTTKVNPYYIKSFFESEQGAAALKSITTGETIPIISVDRLKNLQVPVPDMAEQNKIANKYLAVLDEIQVLKLKLQKATDRLNNVFDEMKEGI